MPYHMTNETVAQKIGDSTGINFAICSFRKINKVFFIELDNIQLFCDSFEIYGKMLYLVKTSLFNDFVAFYVTSNVSKYSTAWMSFQPIPPTPRGPEYMWG